MFNSVLAELQSKTHKNTVGDKRYELSNHLGNVLSVITDRKLLNIDRGIPVVNAGFATAESNPFVPTPQADSLYVETGQLRVAAHKQGHGVETDISLEEGRKYLITFFIDRQDCKSNIEVGLFDSEGFDYGALTNPYEGLLIKEEKPDTYLFGFTAEITRNYKLLFRLREDIEAGSFTLDNIAITDVTDIDYKEWVNRSAEIPIFVPDVLSYNDYYPFGMLMPNRHESSDKYRYAFGGHEKDDEIKGSGNYYDMGARLYDPRIGRTPTLDPAKQLYPGISPYAYAMNTPLQAIDPDGKVIIFINGLWGPLGDINTPLEDYWGSDWVKEVQEHWKDHKKPLFFDGSLGGQLGGSKKGNISSTSRWIAGQEAGYSNAKSIIDNLSAGETIKFVTNSMGAAFQRGFSEGLQLYINELQLGNLQAQQGVMTNINAIQNQLDNFGSSPLLRPGQTYESLQQNLEAQKQKLSQLQTEYQKLEDIRIEIVVDIEPFQQTDRDSNAQKHYYILSDKSKYNTAEKLFPIVGGVQPVNGATDASTKPDGTPVTKGHHSSFVTPTDLPKP